MLLSVMCLVISELKAQLALGLSGQLSYCFTDVSYLLLYYRRLSGFLPIPENQHYSL